MRMTNTTPAVRIPARSHSVFPAIIGARINAADSEECGPDERRGARWNTRMPSVTASKSPSTLVGERNCMVNASNPGGHLEVLVRRTCVMRKRKCLANRRSLLAASGDIHLQPFTGIAFRLNRRAQGFLG